MSKEIRNDSECSKTDDKDWHQVTSIEQIEAAIKKEFSDESDSRKTVTAEVKNDKANWKIVLNKKNEKAERRSSPFRFC